MKISRDGKEYELTFSELIEAYKEYRLDSAIADIKGIYEQKDCEIELTEEQIENIAIDAVHNLSKNENYSNAYWDSLNCTFDNNIEKMVEDIDLPDSITITAATLAVDTDAVYEDKEWLTDTISEYLSDTYGYCTSGFSFEVVYNEFNEPSEIIVTDIQWDVNKEIEEASEEGFEKKDTIDKTIDEAKKHTRSTVNKQDLEQDISHEQNERKNKG